MNRPLGPTPWRWAIRTLPPCLVLVAPIAGGAPVWALHAAPPVARIEERQAGPYHIVVHLSPDPARVTKPLQVGHLRALIQSFAFFLHQGALKLTTKGTKDTKNLL